MTDDTLNVAQDISDEQLDKFFENGGKDMPETKEESVQIDEGIEEGEVNQQTSPETNIEPTQSQEQEIIEEEKHARNYQAAMKEERARRQELQAQLNETKLQQAKMEERFQKLFEIKQQQDMPKPPSFDEDPLGHQQHTIKELQDYVIEQNQYLQKQEQQRLLMEQRRQFEQSYMTKAQEFSQTNPDFMDAYNYLVQKKMSEYMAGGLTKDQANQQITYEEAQIVDLAFRQGVNPAERVYAMAKASGYSKVEGQPQSQNANPSAEVEKKLEQIQKSLAANKSLSQAGGKTDARPSLSLQSIADMDDDEFDKVDWNKVIKAA